MININNRPNTKVVYYIYWSKSKDMPKIGEGYKI